MRPLVSSLTHNGAAFTLRTAIGLRATAAKIAHSIPRRRERELIRHVFAGAIAMANDS
jgi:hypothetical protein